MKKKNNLDEAQELKMLQIEHNAYQIAFWGLLTAVVIQQFFGYVDLRYTIGELSVFMVMCLYVIAGCLKNGIFDRKLKPTSKTSLAMSLIAGAVVAALQFTLSYHNYHKLYGSIAAAVFSFLLTFVITYAALALTTKLYKNRVKKLEEGMEEE